MADFVISEVEEEDISKIRELFKEYEILLGVNLCFQNFEKEVAELPGIYVEPKGCILKLVVNAEIVGVVALKPLSETECEMKRLYVKDIYKGKGFGKKMAEILLDKAKLKGYSKMKLDTLARLVPAVNLYLKLGFKKTEAYNFNPENDILYFEKAL